LPIAKANGIGVYYEVHGEGKPLLLVPGLGSGLSLFANSIPVF